VTSGTGTSTPPPIRRCSPEEAKSSLARGRIGRVRKDGCPGGVGIRQPAPPYSTLSGILFDSSNRFVACRTRLDSLAENLGMESRGFTPDGREWTRCPSPAVCRIDLGLVRDRRQSWTPRDPYQRTLGVGTKAHSTGLKPIRVRNRPGLASSPRPLGGIGNSQGVSTTPRRTAAGRPLK